jgi:O-antigen/teichoic acid export membrane protein
MLVSPFNKLILSRYVGVSAIPIYEIAYNGSMHIRALFEIGLRALMPEVSRISGDMTKYAKYRMSQIYHHAMELVLFGGIPIYGGVIVLLTPLLKLWLGHKFVVELPFVFRIMLISTFLNLISVPAYYILIGLGVVRHTLIAHIIFFCISVLIVLTNVFIWHTVSINTISWTILTATGNASLYLIYKNRCILK